MAEIVPLTVVPNGPDRVQLARTKRCEVIHNRASGSRTAANTDHLMSNSTCLQTGLSQGRVNFQVLIQEEITQYGNTPAMELAQQGLQAIELHE